MTLRFQCIVGTIKSVITEEKKKKKKRFSWSKMKKPLWNGMLLGCNIWCVQLPMLVAIEIRLYSIKLVVIDSKM